MISKLFRLLAMVVILSMIVSPVSAQRSPTVGESSPVKDGSATSTVQPVPEGPTPLDPAGVQRLKDATDGAQITIAPQTGAVRFIRLTPAQAELLTTQLGVGKSPDELALAFFKEYGSIFGLKDPSVELASPLVSTDTYGGVHLTYNQIYLGVPVFAGLLNVHFNAQGTLTAINGMFIPGIKVNPAPSLTPEQANSIAQSKVGAQDASARSTTLVIYRTGLIKGIVGKNHLAYQVEVNNGKDVREFVYVDARAGIVVDRYSGVVDTLTRKVYNQSYPANLVWAEGDPLPYTGPGNPDVSNVISYTKETYDLVYYMTGGAYESYDGSSAVMEGLANDNTPGFCPNAQWNGVFTRFCTGISSRDTVGHEWGHAYTEYTHGLIYQWQSGALSEAYSDIFGETLDQLKVTEPLRTDGACSLYTDPPPTFRVLAPPSIVKDYVAGSAQFGPSLATSPVTDTVVLADDGIGHSGPPVDGSDPVTSDACTPLINAAAINGHIAFVDRGTCTFTVKVKNAQDAGAIGVVIANHAAAGDTPPTMAGSDPTIVIPSISIGYHSGLTVRVELANGVEASLRLMGAGARDDSVRWLSGENDTGFGGAIRDLWTPTCYNLPGKVSDQQYYCGTDDNGGVHYNVGVPSHAFAMLVDGSTYNGQTISAIGLTKAMHIYWRAEEVYQTPTTDFVDHADALEQSCQDLIGVDLLGLATGTPSGEVITTADCQEVTKAIAAVELRNPPVQCDYKPLLNPDAPALCSAATSPATSIYLNNFETITNTWTVTNTGVYAEYNPVDWVWQDNLPGNRSGHAFFGKDVAAGDCNPGSDDQSGARYLISPVITIPSDSPGARLAFDHYVATELSYDGGNLWIKVNSGAWTLVAPADFTFNAYNGTLQPTNPLAGDPGFTGTDGGTVKGSWGRSLVNLSPYASPGDTVQLRYAFGNDGCGGVDGWYVDDVNVYSCQAISSQWDKQVWVNDDGPFDTSTPVDVVAGDVVTIVDRVTVTATNPVTFTLDETWSEALDFLGFTTDAGVVTPGAGTLEWYLNGGDSGETYAITKTFSVNADHGWTGSLTEELAVQGIDTPFSKPVNFSIPVMVAKDAPAQAYTGDLITYTVTINTQDPLSGTFTLTDTLPVGVEFAGGVNASYGTATYSPGNNTVRWTNAGGSTTNAPAESGTRPVALALEATPVGLDTAKGMATLAPNTAINLVLDDGSPESAVADSGWQFLWANRFTPNPADFPFALDTIAVAFVNSTVPVGGNIQLAVYQDADGDLANGATLLQTYNVTVQANDNWNVYTLPSPLTITGPGDVVIAVVNRYQTGTPGTSDYVAALDKTASQQRSWLGEPSSNYVPDPPQLPLDLTWDIIDNLAPALAGNWLIRGYGETIVPVNSITMTFNVTVTAGANTDITNAVVLDYNDHETGASATTHVPGIDLEVVKSATPEVIANHDITYVITVTNHGPDTATEVELIDTLPLSVTVQGSLPVGCTQTGREITCHLGTINSGDSVMITFVVKAPGVPGLITNAVVVKAKEGDLVPGNNTASADTNVYLLKSYLPLITQKESP